MNIEAFSQFANFTILIKIAFLIFSLAHVIFLLVIFNQINSMDKVVRVSNASPLLKTVALSAIIFNASLFLIAIVIL